MNIVLPDGSKKELADGSTVADVAASIGAGLAKAALAGIVNDQPVDLSAPVAEGDSVAIVTAKSDEGLELLRHSTAHVMAAALVDLYGDVQFGVGPAIEDGFYYDVKLDRALSPDDFAAIEARMAEIVKADEAFERRVVTRAEAEEIFASQPFKLELIAELPEDAVITTYTIGKFTDLCRGPHLPSTGKLGAFKLTKLAGAYWRGDAEREMLTRIYGTAFFKQKELDEHLRNLEEAEKRDHRKLGRELGIYTMDPLAGVGLPMYLPKGARVIRTMQEWLRRDLYERGYEEVITPHVYNADVWKTSGHYGFYKENMYFFNINEGTDEDPRLTEYAVKPMNCPGGMLVYKSQPHSYRELPLRVGELGLVHRHELSGALHGLFRVRCFTQDDAHIFMTPDQMKDEIKNTVKLFDEVYSVFGLSYKIELSTMPEDHIGTVEQWEHNQDILKEAITEMGKDYVVNEGDGAFYGPKLDFHLADSLGRTWQCGTIQLDSQLPERFELEYIGADGEKHRPIMIHRVVLGSIERFIGVITEHFAGAFPTWLAPEQVRVMPMTDRNIPCAQEVVGQLTEAGFRVSMDDRNEKIGYKIREAQVHKVPYMVVIGDKDEEKGIISVRERKTGETTPMELSEFIEKLTYEVKEKLK